MSVCVCVCLQFCNYEEPDGRTNSTPYKFQGDQGANSCKVNTKHQTHLQSTTISEYNMLCNAHKNNVHVTGNANTNTDIYVCVFGNSPPEKLHCVFLSIYSYILSNIF